MGKLLTKVDGDRLQVAIDSMTAQSKTNRHDINALRGRVGSLAGRLDTDEDNIDTNAAAIVALDERITALEESGTAVQSKTIVIENPEDGDEFTFFYTDLGLEIVGATVAIQAGTSIAWELWSGESSHQQGEQHFDHTSLVGDQDVFPNVPLVSTRRFLTFVQGTTSGTPTEIAITLFYTVT